jgi:hypothetical protein
MVVECTLEEEEEEAVFGGRVVFEEGVTSNTVSYGDQ